MITTICYWFILLWDVPITKDGFAYMATAELGIEIMAIVAFIPLIINLFRGKNDKDTN